MTETKRAQRRAFEREARRRFGRGQALVVAAEVVAELRGSFGLPTWEAWAATAALMRTHGREPTMRELQGAIAAVNRARGSSNPRERQHAAGVLYCMLQALGRWRVGDGGDAVRLMAPVDLRDHILELSTDLREEEALAQAVVIAVERIEQTGNYREFVLADARTMHAVALLKLPEADAREAGRGLLAEQVAAMERLLASDLVLLDGVKARAEFTNVCWTVHAMAVNNLAQAWAQRVEGDSTENLRRAVELYERCCDLPARIAEPEKLLHSLHHLALCLRDLAHAVDEPAMRGELLQRARVVADRGLALPQSYPHVRFPMFDPLRLNRANTEVYWILNQRENGALAAGDADRCLREHCDASLAWLATSPIREREEGRAAAAFFAQWLGREAEEQAEESAVQALCKLADKLLAAAQRNEQRFMTRDEAEIALSAMMVLTPDGVPSPKIARPEVLSCLPLVMGGVHPLHVGVLSARGLYEVELAWLRHRLRGLGYLGEKYLEDAFTGMHRWMCEPDLPSSHRRVFAGQIARLAALALDPEAGLVGLAPLERMRLHDLTGAAFYRSESTFYGQGESHEAPMGTESGWRISLYRARQELDHSATIRTYDELRSVIEHVQPGVVEKVLAALRTYQAYSLEGIEIRKIGEPLEEMSRLRAEIQEYRRFGRPLGWSPAYVDTTPAPEIGEIESWLRDQSATGVLIAGDDELGLVRVERCGQVVYRRFDELCGDALGRMDEQAEKLSRAWESLLLGPSEEMRRAQHQLDVALADVMLEPGWRGLAEWLAGELVERGTTCVAVIERGAWRAFPWGSLPVGDGTLAEKVAVVHLPTLAATGAKPNPLRDGTFTYVGAEEGASPALEFGRASLRGAGGDVVGPLRREAFEHACISAGVIRVFTHGEFNSVDAPLSGILLDAKDDEWPYQGYEIAAMDLRGCGRVELWACDSGVQMDFLGDLLGNDEPLGIASCFLLAGAHVVVGSLWKQPAIVAGLIAAAFAAVTGPPGSAKRDAYALARALAAYRRVIGEGGFFEEVLCRDLAESIRAGRPPAGAVACAVHAAWSAAAAQLAGYELITIPVAAFREFDGYDGYLDALHDGTDDPEQLDRELHRLARRLTSVLRTRAAWAGWRVIARDKSILCTSP